jgi:MerR family transcriptional regulator, thiopeptide resistance regulator
VTRTAATGAPGRRVGELAAATGLTVRTLHHYEEVGLLVASERSPAGHRLYSDSDVERLYRICLLRRLGLGLAETARALDDPAWGLRAAMQAHLAELERRAEREAVLRFRLSRLLDAAGTPGVDLVDVLEEMTMLDATVQKRISILVYADLDAAHEQLVRAFGLGPGELTREDGGRAVHAELQAGDGVLWLHQESETFRMASPRTLGATTASVAVMVDDVDAHCAHARAEGVEIVYDPVDQPYGYREYSARDGEGHLWSFMKPLD